MNEFQPNEENEEQESIPKFYIETPNGIRFECTPENTIAFVFSEEPQYNGIFIHEEDKNGEVTGNCFWEESFPNFDQLIEWMLGYEYQVIKTDKAGEPIKEAYRQQHNRPEASEEFVATVVDNDPDKHLTPRQGRRVDFLGYILEHDLLTADDFYSEDDSII